jgi:hypothetical protein
MDSTYSAHMRLVAYPLRMISNYHMEEYQDFPIT